MNLYKERDRICREIGDIDSLSVISRQPGVDSRSRGGMEGAIK